VAGIGLLAYSFVGDSQSVDEPAFEPWFALLLAIGFNLLLIAGLLASSTAAIWSYRRLRDDPFRPA